MLRSDYQTVQEFVSICSTSLLANTGLALVSVEPTDPTVCGVETVPFSFRPIIEFNRTCSNSALSAADMTALEDAYVNAYNNLGGSTILRSILLSGQERCDCQQAAVATQGKLSVEIEVNGTLRCLGSSSSSCNPADIGLDEIPSPSSTATGPVTRRHIQLLEASCGCPAYAVADRGSSEKELVDELQRQVSQIDSSLTCSALQVSTCDFGPTFETTIQVTLADAVAAKNASAAIEVAALQNLNSIFTPDSSNTCNPDFRVFQNVRLVFVGSSNSRKLSDPLLRHRKLQKNNTTFPTLMRLSDWPSKEGAPT